MADPRTFTLIGEFQDGITPALEGINSTLNRLQSNMRMMSSRQGGLKDVTLSIGKLISAHRHLKNSVKELREEMEESLSTLRMYRNEMGKANRAHHAIARTGSRAAQSEAKHWQSTRKDLDGYVSGLRELGRGTRQIRVASGMGRMSGVIGESRRGPGRPPGGGPPRGPGPGPVMGGGENFHMGAFAFGMTLGQGISQPVTTAIMTGFQLGVGLMVKPFQYFAENLQERIQDEMSDLKAAGGFFSLSRDQKPEDRLVKNFDEAVEFTKSNNRLLDRFAASLPGSTQDYIEVSKRISDSIARTVVRDRAGTFKLAQQIYDSDSTFQKAGLKGPMTQQKAVQILLADLTKSTVLAGQGGRAGTGGPMGAYGLPQLTERMLGEDQVSMGKFQRYSAIFSDPMIMDALAREIPKINATAANSADRIEAIRKMYERVLPKELVERYRRTMAGLIETFNTAIFGKESGIFGLGRPLKGISKKMNEFGQYVSRTGKAVSDASLAMEVDLPLYDIFKDAVTNLGQVLAPIVENLSILYDPFQSIAEVLEKARRVTGEVLRTFNYYLKGFEEFAKNTFSPLQMVQFNETGGARLRATVLAIGNLFRALGVLSNTDFKGLVTQLKDPKANVGNIITDQITKFFDSEAATKLGEFVGKLLGTVLTEVAKVTGFISKRIGPGRLGAGIATGFNAAGGPLAFKNIFKDVFELLFKAIGAFLKVLPTQAYLLAGAAILIPAAIAGLAMSFSQFISKMIRGVATRCFSGRAAAAAAQQASCGAMGAGFGGAGGAGRRRGRGGNMFITERGQRIARRKSQTPYAGPIGPVPGHTFYRGKRTAYMQPGLTATGGAQRMGLQARNLLGLAQGRSLIRQRGRVGDLARTGARAGRFVPGGALAFGAIDAGLRMASGQDAGRAIGGAAASTIGATLGGILGQALIPVPGLGAALGTIAGGFLGDKVFSTLMPASTAQEQAAKLQMEAANAQLRAAEQGQLAAAYGLDLGYSYGEIAEITKRFQYMGYGQNPQVQALIKEYAQRNVAQEKLKQADAAIAAKIAELNRYNITDPAERAKELAPLEANARRLATVLAKEQADLDAAFKKLPEKIELALRKNAEKVSFQKVVDVLAEQARRAGEIMAYNARIGAAMGGGRGGNNAPVSDQEAASTKSYGKYYSGNNSWRGSLSKALSSEAKHKPPGSDIVIANSSETVIPAAGGYGMKEFIRTMRTGFANLGAYDVSVASLRASNRPSSSTPVTLNNSITITQQPGQDSEELAAVVLQYLGNWVSDARAASIFV
jgi:hypothetical protein